MNSTHTLKPDIERALAVLESVSPQLARIIQCALEVHPLENLMINDLRLAASSLRNCASNHAGIQRPATLTALADRLSEYAQNYAQVSDSE